MQARNKKVRGILLFSRDGRTTPDPGLSDAGLARANLPDDLATVSGAFGLEFVQGEPSCPYFFCALQFWTVLPQPDCNFRQPPRE